jgi:hypothetical protein
MEFTERENQFIEQYMDSTLPKTIQKRAFSDAEKGLYIPPVWTDERSESLRLAFKEAGYGVFDIEEMIKKGRKNFKRVIDLYNDTYRAYQEKHSQVAQ